MEALLRAGAYPCFRDNHLISPLHLASTQAGDKDKFRRIAELLGPSALLARDEVRVCVFACVLLFTCCFGFPRDSCFLSRETLLRGSLSPPIGMHFLLRKFSNFRFRDNYISMCYSLPPFPRPFFVVDNCRQRLCVQ